MLILTLAIVATCVVASGGDVQAAASSAAQPAQQDEFVPIDELPPGDRLPAAPLLVAAYAFAWLAVFGYLWSIWRRLAKVEQELADVARRAAER
ncbi:MAG: CcmD family protein [Vicinamibacterales bacterium]|nr:CcmD family protein [Vicinamibacterales bacterium]MDP6609859.1 CcmD family protein [Vicinamibacterales bacterium]